jgi:hypothetical protein
VEDASELPSEESSGRRSRYHERPTEEILAMLPALVGTADRVEAEVAGWVGRSRERGADWQDIAGTMGWTPTALAGALAHDARDSALGPMLAPGRGAGPNPVGDARERHSREKPCRRCRFPARPFDALTE